MQNSVQHARFIGYEREFCDSDKAKYVFCAKNVNTTELKRLSDQSHNIYNLILNICYANFPLF